jgi:hypothetical protein
MDLLGEAVSFAGIEEAMADIEKSAQNTELSTTTNQPWSTAQNGRSRNADFFL